MNITLVQAEYKPFDTIFCPLSTEEFEKLRQAGIVAKKKRIYRVVLHYRDIQVECPVQLDGKNPVSITLPAFKLPYRKYPIYVYLYATAMYLAGESMRKAARKTGEKFGIPKFSHSTVSRTLDSLTLKIYELAAISPPEPELPQAGAGTNRAAPVAKTCQPSLVVRPRWKEARKQAAPRLFDVLKSILSSPESGSRLAYRYFTQYGRLLL
ncbi:MAG: hypothetical protein PHP56_12490 [Smithellaceae bacterium]|nr:hypothetical protein [Smithellaceae bacterium]